MNKRVLKTMIYLCWAFLLAYALLKTVWADAFSVSISNAKIIAIGNFIDKRFWLRQTIYAFTTLLTYHFYLCACCFKWHLNLKETIISLVFIIPVFILNIYVPSVGYILGYLIMFLIPYLLKANYKQVVIIYSTHILGQILISFIRSQPVDLIDINILTQLICVLDMYVWLLLYYLYANIYKENIVMGNLAPPVWGKMSKQVEKEIAKIDKKLEGEKDEAKVKKLLDKRAEYEKMLAEDNGKN